MNTKIFTTILALLTLAACQSVATDNATTANNKAETTAISLKY